MRLTFKTIQKMPRISDSIIRVQNNGVTIFIGPRFEWRDKVRAKREKLENC